MDTYRYIAVWHDGKVDQYYVSRSWSVQKGRTPASLKLEIAKILSSDHPQFEGANPDEILVVMEKIES